VQPNKYFAGANHIGRSVVPFNLCGVSCVNPGTDTNVVGDFAKTSKSTSDASGNRGPFTPEFKQEAACLVLDQGDTVAEYRSESLFGYW
jgi:hypothetical protein